MADDFEERIVLDRFKLTKLLGQGGMGAVYKAEHIHLGSEHAVKALHGFAGLPEDLRKQMEMRFLREAKILGQIKHPNLVSVSDFGAPEGTPYLIMDFIDGQDLMQILDERRMGFDDISAVRILRDSASAIGALHEHGIIHRDLKPPNIMIENGTGRVILTDLGIAKDLESGDNVTQSMLGTPSYMAPEQMVDASKTTFASDVYGLGATFYAVLFATDPFRGDSALVVMNKARESLLMYGSLAGMATKRENRKMAKPVEDILHGMTLYDHTKRFQTMQEVIEQCNRALAELDPNTTLAPEDANMAQVHAAVGDAANMTLPMAPGTVAHGGAVPGAGGSSTTAQTLAMSPDGELQQPRRPETSAALAALSGDGGTDYPGPAGGGSSMAIYLMLGVLLLGGGGGFGYWWVKMRDDGRKGRGIGGGVGGERIILDQPVDRKVLEGAIATFSVKSGAKDAKYQWSRNGEEISGATGSQLKLTSVTLADNGAKIQCVVTSEKGTKTSRVAILTVEDPDQARPRDPLPLAMSPDRFQIPLPGGSAPMELTLVRPGTFKIGDADGKRKFQVPARDIELTKHYYIGVYEVTNEQFVSFLNDKRLSRSVGIEPEKTGIEWVDDGWDLQVGLERYPLRTVDHVTARMFCQWLHKKFGLKVDLPSEVEWEYAARGPDSPTYPWGNTWQNGMAHADGKRGPRPVGSFLNGRSWCGAYDMAGNVFEWCADRWDGERYRDIRRKDPPPLGAGFSDGYRVFRGGSFGNPSSACRGSYRMAMEGSSDACGFRIKVLPTYQIVMTFAPKPETPATPEDKGNNGSPSDAGEPPAAEGGNPENKKGTAPEAQPKAGDAAGSEAAAGKTTTDDQPAK